MTNTVPSIRGLDRPVDRIRLHVQVDKRPIVTVEGNSDKRFLERLSNKALAVFPCGNREKAISTAKDLVGHISNGLACVIDRDFEPLPDDNSIPLFPYENADLEAMVLNEEGVSDLVSELGSAEKIKQVGGIRKIDSISLEIVLKIAALRRANVEKPWNLAFDQVELAKKIDTASLTLKIVPYCTALHAASELSPGVKVLIEYVDGTRSVATPVVCPRIGARYFRGRDYLAVLGVALVKKIGSQQRAAVGDEALAKIARLAAASNDGVMGWYRDLTKFIESRLSSASAG